MRDWRVETERIFAQADVVFPTPCFESFVLNKGLRWLHDKTLSFPPYTSAFPMIERLGKGRIFGPTQGVFEDTALEAAKLEDI